MTTIKEITTNRKTEKVKRESVRASRTWKRKRQNIYRGNIKIKQTKKTKGRYNI